MEKGKQIITVKCDGREVNKIESFVDSICDEHNVYNNYFGNMVISLVSIHDECRNRKGDNAKMDFEFFTNSKGLNFRVYTQDEDMLKEAEMALSDSELMINDEKYNWIFLINSLCDELVVERSSLLLEYDVASINRELSASRVVSLRAYFKGATVENDFRYN
jgi:hypothetical protein